MSRNSTIANPPIDQPLPRLRLGTRGSPLALAQAHELADRLARAHGFAKEAVAITIIRTSGDMIQDRPLSLAGGKGLFTKELDQALIEGMVDLAVHSAKDLPTILPEDLIIAGYLPREDVRDVWISPKAGHPRDLPPGSVVGTASLRRGALLKRLRPDLEVRLLRGNVETRLAKLAAGEVDATLLALAGLRRLGLADKATQVLAIEDFLPAAGQGAIGITTRRDDAATLALLAPILDPATHVALAAERGFLTVLDGSCKTPIGAHATVEHDQVTLRGIVLRPDGSEWFEACESGPLESGSLEAARELGETAARAILARLPEGFFQESAQENAQKNAKE
ncbi:hydroxymethylbilane synthase [Beijerinckia indica]|uniref:Porphobilinogen deaminase n=1 Tax=Beijerinckia indica subsp. indica (strain ATCC 9039 / DSM 1715 / NCIMB 8712) TaxID=395963 RepID=B2IAW6_BEII9|nr:hydroxymethylbilane synthase [Beijerinckia indica]ACB93666.1 porphobilinogen deaminase [Beijerinckia indica subsp. indica ATCC 9039]